MAIFYLDFEGGNDAADGTTFANRWKTITSGATAARIAPGDEIRIMASPEPTSLGQDATWTDGSTTITLTSAVTASIDDCETAWVPSTNVTSDAYTTYRRQGAYSTRVIPASAFTTGKLAYKTLDAALDLSDYQQVSLYVRPNTANFAAGVFELRLCSDTTGDAAVNTFTLPALAQGNWHAITLDHGSALGATIQSIALYATSDPGTSAIHLDNILACKAPSVADALTLNSLIGKSADGADGWWPILSIEGTTIALDGSYANAALTALTYCGTTETTAIFRREPILLAATVATYAQEDGTDAAPITYSGGWDRSAMTVQSGQTWAGYDTCNIGAGYSTFYTNGKSHLSIDRLFAARGAGIGTFSLTRGLRVGTTGAAGSAYGLKLSYAVDARVTEITQAIGCEYAVYGERGDGVRIDRFDHFSGNAMAIYATQYMTRLVVSGGTRPGRIRGGQFGFRISEGSWGCRLVNAVLSGNTRDVYAPGSSAVYGRVELHNCALNSATQIDPAGGLVYSTRHQQTVDNHLVRWRDDAGTIASTTVQRHTASGIAWEFRPTSTTYIHSAAPLALSVAKIACAANEARSVSLWFRRDNAGLSMRLRVPGGQLAGVADDVTGTMTAGADTWEQLTLNFTPTEAGVIEVFADAWGGTTYAGWIDDLSVT